jgi:hypothetical protein
VIVFQEELDPIFLPIVREAQGHGDRSHEDDEGLRRFACWPLLPAASHGVSHGDLSIEQRKFHPAINLKTAQALPPDTSTVGAVGLLGADEMIE